MLSSSFGRLVAASPALSLRRAAAARVPAVSSAVPSVPSAAYLSTAAIGRLAASSSTPPVPKFTAQCPGSRGVASWSSVAAAAAPAPAVLQLPTAAPRLPSSAFPLLLPSPYLSAAGIFGSAIGAVRGVKTNRAAAKRIRVMGSGRLKRAKAGRRHNTGYLTRKRKNNLARGTGIKGKKHEKRMRRLIGAL